MWDGSEYETENCGNEHEIELSDDQYWAAHPHAYHPVGWAWHWWGDEWDLMLSKSNEYRIYSHPTERSDKQINPLFIIAGFLASVVSFFMFVGIYVFCCQAKHSPYDDLDLDLITQ